MSIPTFCPTGNHHNEMVTKNKRPELANLLRPHHIYINTPQPRRRRGKRNIAQMPESLKVRTKIFPITSQLADQ